MVLLYAARVQDLGPEDFVVFKCGACGHTWSRRCWPHAASIVSHESAAAMGVIGTLVWCQRRIRRKPRWHPRRALL